MSAFAVYMRAIDQEFSGRQGFVTLTQEEANRLGTMGGGGTISDSILPVGAALFPASLVFALNYVSAYRLYPVPPEAQLVTAAFLFISGVLLGRTISISQSGKENDMEIGLKMIEMNLRPPERILNLPALDKAEIERRNYEMPRQINNIPYALQLALK